MANAEDDAFDELFAEIMAEPDAKIADVADDPSLVPSLEDAKAVAVAAETAARETLIQSVIAEPLVETPKPDKERVEYKTVDKVDIEGSPLVTKVYPLGYMTLLIPGFRFQNKACFYRAEFMEFVSFLRDAAKSDPWLASMDKAGFRNRGEARKEG